MACCRASSEEVFVWAIEGSLAKIANNTTRQHQILVVLILLLIV